MGVSFCLCTYLQPLLLSGQQSSVPLVVHALGMRLVFNTLFPVQSVIFRLSMAGNFWESSHCQEWLLDKQEIELGRQKDLQYLTVDDLQKVHIFYTNYIQCLGGEQLKLRQQVISTAIVYYRRFYSRNSLGDVDPLLLCPTCIHLASKVEECGVVSTTQLLMKSRVLIRQKYSGIFKLDYPYKVQQILECEFLLLEMLDCCLIVYHPYRPLTQYVTDLGQQDALLPTAWRIVNDTYR